MYSRISYVFSSIGTGKYLLASALCALVAVLAACGGGGSEAPAAATTGGSENQESAAAQESQAMQEPEVKIQLVCINRTGNPCTLIYSTEEEHGVDGFIERVKDRTNGRVEFQVSSFPELGPGGSRLAAPD